MAKEVVLAVISFVLGAVIFCLSLYTLILEELHTSIDEKPVVLNTSQHFQHVFGLHLDKTSIDLIVSFVLLLSCLTMIVSILLVIGIKKNKPYFVLAYFSFSTLLSLLFLISAVLEVLQRLWIAAGISALLACIMAWCLSDIYSVYENIEKESDQNSLLNENEPNVPFDSIISD